MSRHDHDPNDARFLTVEGPAGAAQLHRLALGLVSHVNDRPVIFHGEAQPAGEVACVAAALVGDGVARVTFALLPHGQLHWAFPPGDFSGWLEAAPTRP